MNNLKIVDFVAIVLMDGLWNNPKRLRMQISEVSHDGAAIPLEDGML
jgi:hypothetical protein